MYPSKYGDVVVWQGWVGNDWEIMLEADREFTMLTDNTFHDVSPSINGDHIIWQSFEDTVWKVKVYDMVTKTTDTITDSEGGSVENPRFVLVYDTKFDNGDTETKGYDLKSGEVVPLSSKPGPMPERIPDPDPTDEDRAILQTVTQTKPKPESDHDFDDAPPDMEPQATTTDELVIVPPEQEATSTEEVLVPEQTDAEEIVIEDLHIFPPEEPATTSESVPEDLVIPAFEAATTTLGEDNFQTD